MKHCKQYDPINGDGVMLIIYIQVFKYFESVGRPTRLRHLIGVGGSGEIFFSTR